MLLDLEKLSSFRMIKIIFIHLRYILFLMVDKISCDKCHHCKIWGGTTIKGEAKYHWIHIFFVPLNALYAKNVMKKMLVCDKLSMIRWSYYICLMVISTCPLWYPFVLTSMLNLCMVWLPTWLGPICHA
jgi:hypothetical protein